MTQRDETHAEIISRLQANWDRNREQAGTTLMRSINDTTASEAFFWTGIERDLVVYALAFAYGEDGNKEDGK